MNLNLFVTSDHVKHVLALYPVTISWVLVTLVEPLVIFLHRILKCIILNIIDDDCRYDPSDSSSLNRQNVVCVGF